MTQQNINLNLNDLRNMVNIIDYAAQQGSFKGWETIRQVMEVREKVALFLQAAEQAEAEKAAAADGPEFVYDEAPEVEPAAEEEAKPKRRAKK